MLRIDALLNAHRRHPRSPRQSLNYYHPKIGRHKNSTGFASCVEVGSCDLFSGGEEGEMRGMVALVNLVVIAVPTASDSANNPKKLSFRGFRPPFYDYAKSLRHSKSVNL